MTVPLAFSACAYNWYAPVVSTSPLGQMNGCLVTDLGEAVKPGG